MKENNKIDHDTYVALVVVGLLIILLLLWINASSAELLIQILGSAFLLWATYYRQRNLLGLLVTCLLPLVCIGALADITTGLLLGLALAVVLIVAAIAERLIEQKFFPFRQLPFHKRLAFLEVILEIERRRLRIRRPVALRAKDMAVGTLGYVNNMFSDTIYISKATLMDDAYSVREMIDTLCHEIYHLHQGDCLLFEVSRKGLSYEKLQRIELYRKERLQYRGKELNFSQYSNLSWEIDARAYAKKRWQKFYKANWRRLMACIEKERAGL